MVRVRCSDFEKLRYVTLRYVYAVYSNRRPPSLFASIAKFSDGRLEKNFEEMVGTRKSAVMATKSGGDETATRPRTTPGTRLAATAGDEMAATGGADEGELEFDENEMAALEGQRLVVELFPDSGSEPDYEGFHASEPAGYLSGGDDSGFGSGHRVG